MRADRVGEIALEALRDQDRGHLRCGQKEPTDRLSWPIADIGRILTLRPAARFSGCGIPGSSGQVSGVVARKLSAQSCGHSCGLARVVLAVAAGDGGVSG